MASSRSSMNMMTTTSRSLALLVCMAAALAMTMMQPAASAPPPPATTTTLAVASPAKATTLKCTNTKTKKTTCSTTCNKRCPNKCLIQCPSCKTFCLCDFYPGVSCGDPRFTGADGNNFYFHGKKDQDFCIVSDAGLHINAHFIGKRNPAMRRDFTWIQALGIRFQHHQLYVGATKTATWDDAADHLALAFDDDDRLDVPRFVGARWSPSTAPALSVTRTAEVNTVVVELRGVFRIVANVVPISAEESRIHNYGVTDDDSLAHLDLGFKFYDLTDDVHGVLGQTYRPDYVNRLNVTSNMPVMGGAPDYRSSDLFSTDCAVARFGGRNHQQLGAAAVNNIAMVTDDME